MNATRGSQAELAGRLAAAAGERPTLAAALDGSLALAAERGAELYLAGGAVRDLLLGRPLADLDLVVAGEALDFARALARKLGAEIEEHPALGTARLELDPGENGGAMPSSTAAGTSADVSCAARRGLRIDVATARAETYDAPGRLPTVRPAPIEADLVRRDFGVNAMALRLAPSGPAGPGAREAELVDPAGGRRDLERRELRILHPRSFEDDPTRILRGLRYALRLGLAWEAGTESSARRALAAGALATVSGGRLRHELELLFAEPAPLAASVDALARLEVLPALAPGVAWGRAERRRLSAAEAAAKRLYIMSPTSGGEDGPRRLWLALLVVAGHSPETAAAAGERLALAPRRRERLAGAAARIEAAAARLQPLDPAAGASPLPAHAAAEAMAGLELEELLLLAAAGPEAAVWVERELQVHRRLELEIGGADLLAHGFAAGPAIGRALAATRRARLDGAIEAADELEFALAQLAEEGR